MSALSIPYRGEIDGEPFVIRDVSTGSDDFMACTYCRAEIMVGDLVALTVYRGVIHGSHLAQAGARLIEGDDHA